MDVADLVEIEEIRQLKYRYLRLVDTNNIDGLAACFSHDAIAEYRHGRVEGRESILEFLRRVHRVSFHTVHQPEIKLESATSASGEWALEDTQFYVNENIEMHLAGRYHDTYVKVDGRWLIRSTGYTVLFEHRTPIVGEVKTP